MRTTCSVSSYKSVGWALLVRLWSKTKLNEYDSCSENQWEGVCCADLYFTKVQLILYC